MLENVEWETCLLEPHHDRALERYVRSELGAVQRCCRTSPSYLGSHDR